MTGSETTKFRPLTVLLESVVFVWWYRFRFLKCLSIPTLILVAVWALRIVMQIDPASLSNWAFWFLYQVGFVFFAVACHRLVLLNEADFALSSMINKRAAIFLFWSLTAAVGSFVVIGAILTAAVNLPAASTLFIDADSFYFIQLLATIPACYLVGRFILIFPATAVDEKSGLRLSWRQTKGNGWKIVLVIGIYPWLISVIIWLAAGDQPHLLVELFTALLYYLGMALEVTALSFTFKSLVRGTGQDATRA